MTSRWCYFAESSLQKIHVYGQLSAHNTVQVEYKSMIVNLFSLEEPLVKWSVCRTHVFPKTYKEMFEQAISFQEMAGVGVWGQVRGRGQLIAGDTGSSNFDGVYQYWRHQVSEWLRNNFLRRITLLNKC